jgi:uncharacterized membrane protein YphA (DoxX/SURF4 family)
MKLSDITGLIGKYIFPVLLLLIGVGLLMAGMQATVVENVECNGEILPSQSIEQTDYFRYAGFGFMALAIISTLFVAGVITRMVAIILSITVFPATFAVLSWFSIQSVDEQLEWQNKKDLVYQATKQRMKDIRDAQVEYKVKYNRYAADFAELTRFLRDDKVANIKKEGTPPDRKITLKEAFLLGFDTVKFLIPNSTISEMEAVKLGAIARDESRREEIERLFGSNEKQKKDFLSLASIIRDTTYISVTEKLFTGSGAKTRDPKFPFQLDSLEYRPFSGAKVKLMMIADSIQKNDTVYAPVFLVKDPMPFKFNFLDDECKSRDTLIIGSLTSTSTNGNWK